MSNFLFGFLAGAAAGAIAGILFAPDKGSVTRQNLKKRVRELSDEFDLGLGDFLDELSVEPEPAPKPKRKYKRKAKPAN